MMSNMNPTKKAKLNSDHVLDFVKSYTEERGKEQALAEAFGHVKSLNELKTYLESDESVEKVGMLITVYELHQMKRALTKEVPNSLKLQMLKTDIAFKIPPKVFIDIDPPGIGTMDLQRQPPILVMGSSGSGKTSYSFGVLPRLLQKYDDNLFFVYMNANTAFNNRKPTTAAKAGKHMRAQIEEAVQEHGGDDAKSLTMIVIIDEIGIKKDAIYVGNSSTLNAIENELEGLAKQVRLVLSGTGLDQITTMVNSDQEATKIRLPPWDRSMVDSYIDRIHGQFSVQLKGLIWPTPLYTSLSSNPRALSHLTTVLCEQLKIYDKDTINEDFVVAEVTRKYIKANGLGTLLANEKRLVAMIVWKALSDAEHEATTPLDLALPMASGCHNDDKIEACCHSLLDVHLESKNGKLVLTEGQDYAISITSAISLVLLALTGNVASLCRNWEQFETVAALHELQLAYVSNFPHCPPPIKVVASRTQFPGEEKKIIRIPVVDKKTIVVNGAMADYADVISFDRLVQAKHQEEGLCYDLKLTTELKKVGVIKENHAISRGRRTTALLRERWTGATSHEVDDSATKAKELGTAQFPAKTRHGAAVSKLSQYPYKLRFPFTKKSITETVKNQTRPLSVVFVTNAAKFRIPKKETDIGTDTYLMRQHVDRNGTLLVEGGDKGGKNVIPVNENLQKYMDNILLDGVSVKFFFLEQDGN